MLSATQYELLDFGSGRKLERFGKMVLDRPSPAAEKSQRCAPNLWTQSGARDEPVESSSPHSRGRWIGPHKSDEWTIRHEQVCFQLKLTDFGHVGIFPEQVINWDWISQQIRALIARGSLVRIDERSAEGLTPDISHNGCPRILNLFAYTGASTLAAAGSGAAVAHVDAARNVVAWARGNAELSGFSSSPIRWITDDVRKFVRRELRRGRRYDGVILD